MSHGWYTCPRGHHYFETEHPSGRGDCPRCDIPRINWAGVSHIKELRALTFNRLGLKEACDIAKETRNWAEAEALVKARYALPSDTLDVSEVDTSWAWL